MTDAARVLEQLNRLSDRLMVYAALIASMGFNLWLGYHKAIDEDHPTLNPNPICHLLKEKP